METIIVPELYEILKEMGFSEGSDEFDAVMAAFILGQRYMQDAAIKYLGTYEANQCAQVVAGIPLCSGRLAASVPMFSTTS